MFGGLGGVAVAAAVVVVGVMCGDGASGCAAGVNCSVGAFCVGVSIVGKRVR